MSCKYDAEKRTYLDYHGDECHYDAEGEPTRHCSGRRTCAQHVYGDEQVCSRCVDRVRRLLRRIPDLAALMLPAAISAGVNSEAANLAGPAADAEAWSWRKVAANQGRAWHVSLIEDDDEHHPVTVTTTWARMIAEDYDDEAAFTLPDPDGTGRTMIRYTLTSAVAYLDRVMRKLANDPEQDFAQLAREMRACVNHLESVIHNSTRPERGVPCFACVEAGHSAPRLVRHYGHWCEDPDCEEMHYADEAGDEWRCSNDRTHVWSHERYDALAAERVGRPSARITA